MNSKKFQKLSHAEQLSTLVALMSDFTESYFGSDFYTDQSMAVEISYLRGIVQALHTQNMISLGQHKNIAEQSIALEQKRFTSDNNPFF